MDKSYWNRKSVYSIRKFSVGTCSVLIGTCAVLFGANLAGTSPVFADETPITVNAEKGLEEAVLEQVADTSQTSTVEETVAKEKEEQGQVIKEAKEISKSVEKDTKVELGASSQEKPIKEEVKAATNEEVNQMIEDRKVNFNQNWHFKLNANSKEAVKPDADVSTWQKLDLPHDWSIFNDFDHQSPAQNEGGQLNGGEAWYRKTFKLDEKDLKKNVRVTFDGVYMDSQV